MCWNNLLIFIFIFGLFFDVFDLVGGLVGGNDLEIIGNSVLLEELFGEIFEISLGNSFGGSDLNILSGGGAGDTFSEIAFFSVEFDVGLEEILEVFGLDQVVFVGHSEVDCEFEGFFDSWVFLSESNHPL